LDAINQENGQENEQENWDGKHRRNLRKFRGASLTSREELNPEAK
jgi:hypothetical protein